MFGYVIPNAKDLQEKEAGEYRAWYCGLCQCLRERYGITGQLSLSYEMTFLAILLSGLYEPDNERTVLRCMLHPVKKRQVIQNPYVSYAADMNILLTYYKCRDDWEDEHRFTKAAYGKVLHKKADSVAAEYPRQAEAVQKYLLELSKTELENCRDIDQVSGLFGRICAELFVMQPDEWEDILRRMGFFLGKFIYLLDAWEDLEQDRKKGCYNPLYELSSQEGFEERFYQILTMMMAESSKAFERLPILEHTSILRNILYSGVWSRYYHKKTEHSDKKDR